MTTHAIRAAVKTGVEHTELQTFARPAPSPTTGLLRVESCGVGGSDPETYRKLDHAPVIMGHEVVGVIDEVGEAATARWGVKPGDRVALHEYLPCWRCRWCLQGDYRLCEEVDFFLIKDRLNTPRIGMSTSALAPHLWGGFAEYMHLPANAVIHRIPSNLDARLATLAIPFGNGFQWAVLDGGTRPGDTVLVFGPGQQGLGCALAAKVCGADRVILVGQARDRARLELARGLGVDVVLESSTLGDIEAEVGRLTVGRGVDVVVDTTGDPTGEIATSAVACSAKGAVLNLNGLDQVVPLGEIKRRYLTVRAPRGHSRHSVDLALQLIASGRWPLDRVCSHDFGLEEVDLAIKATAGREVQGAVHVTVSPWRDSPPYTQPPV